MMNGDVQNEAGVAEGTILAGKYRVEKVLGVGGMGVVVAAHHVHLDEKVAIKFLLPTMLQNQDIVGRFAREARAAVKIKSEHVARVSDVGKLENGAPYMVMEFLEGEDLAGWMQRQGPMPIDQAVDFILQACVGVASAHGIGIVHRDLKPANLFCLRGNDGEYVIKVLDFGISKVSNLAGSGESGSMTRTSAVMGSPFYMSPEQMQSTKDVDTRTDIWALGVVLYELLAGTTPFSGESYAEIAIKVATASFPPVRSFRPEVPFGLEGVLLKCLEKDKRKRYENVAEVAVALGEFGSKRSRPSIERTVGIIRAAGLSTSAVALPPSLRAPGAPVTAGTMLSAPGEPLLQPGLRTGGHPGTMAPSVSTRPGARETRGRRTLVVAIAGGAGALAIGMGIVWKVHARSDATSNSMGPTDAPAMTALTLGARPDLPRIGIMPKPTKPAEPPADSRPASDVDASKTKADSPAVAAPAPPAAAIARSAPRAPAQATAGAPPSPTPPTPPTPAARAGSGAPANNCRVVSFFDADGNQHFKQQCGN